MNAAGYHVVILAAGQISDKLTFLRCRCASPALIPVNTRPLAAYLVDFYSQHPDCKIHLAVNSEVTDAVSAELRGLDTRYQLIPVVNSTGVVDSLEQALRSLPFNCDVIVNLVTSIPERVVESGEVVIANTRSNTAKWSGINVIDGRPQFVFKTSPHCDSSHAFTGIFRSNVTFLRGAVAATPNRSDLLAVVEQLHRTVPLQYIMGEWIDCGHETNYYDAKSRLISSRSFNAISVSLDDGVAAKRSRDVVKLQREAAFVEMLPSAVSVFFPRIVAKTFSDSTAGQLELEYYGYPSVAEYYLYWDLGTENWARLFSRLGGVLKRFASFPYSISRSAFEDFYLQKTVSRVEALLSGLSAELRQRLEGDIVVNGRICPPFATLVPELERKIAGIYRDTDFCVMHGDFCFSNMLYDVPSGIVRLIDPRGSFGERCIGIYGDRKYDLAKLKHSAEFGYDFIVNGLFQVAENGGAFNYSFASRDCAATVKDLVRDLVCELSCDNDEINLLTSLLFLSMGPLHADAPSRQLVMYLHGLQLLVRCLEN